MTPSPSSPAPLPGHLAIIMDGNGRWAQLRGRPRTHGHVAGAQALRLVVEHCARRGVDALTLYAFSSDNWKRPAREVRALLTLFAAHLESEADALARDGIRLSVVGRRDRLTPRLRRTIHDAEQRTAGGGRMHLRIAIDYSSRYAIEQTLAPRPAMHDGDAQALLPPVDLLLRTGGERRLSDFLLWECAYAELLFLDVLWPDMTAQLLDDALADFAHRDRRFGNVTHRASA